MLMKMVSQFSLQILSITCSISLLLMLKNAEMIGNLTREARLFSHAS